jgi:hypothetical protein
MLLFFSLFYYTSSDAPEDDSIVPSFIEATGDQVYIRRYQPLCSAKLFVWRPMTLHCEGFCIR